MVAERDLDDYVTVSVLGHGAAGMVARSRDTVTGATVAVRYLSRVLTGSHDFMAGLREDVSRLDVLEHRNVAHVYELIEEDEKNALVTELVEGPSLREVLRAGPLEPTAALYVAAATFAGLTEIHDRGVVHGALRPASLLVDPTGTVKIVDVALTVPGHNAPQHAPYVAPELVRGGRPGVSSDVFATAAVLFECLTGKPPQSAIAGPSGASDDPTSVGPWPEDRPQVLRAYVVAGLAEQPGARPSDARAAKDQLELLAFRLYGSDWVKAGRASLLRRLAQVRSAAAATSARGSGTARAGVSPLRPAWAALLPSDRARASGARAAAGRPGRRRTMWALLMVSLLALLGAGTAYAIAGRHDGGASGAQAGITNSHVAMDVPGPTVPVPVSHPSAATDTTSPAAPAGVHVTGRSITAVTIDWAAAMDDVKVAGYIVMRDGKQVGTSYLPGFTDDELAAETRYRYEVTAFDAAGNKSPPSAAITAMTLAAPDVAPPSVPTGLHPTGKTTTSIVLAWNRSKDNVGVAGYEVYRDGSLISNVTQPGFVDTKLAPASTHTYRLRSFDTSSNASGDSNSVTVTTLTAPDESDPSVPGDVVAQGTGPTTIGVSWDPATDNVGVTSYRVYRDGNLAAEVAGPSFTDQGLIPATSYTYIIRALDAAGNTSGASAPASASTGPAPTTPPPTTEPTTDPTTEPTTEPTTTPPDPPGEIMSVELATTIDGCIVTIKITVVASAPMVAPLNYTITGTSGGTEDLTFNSDTLTQTFDLPQTGDANDAGSATATVGTLAAIPVDWTATCAALSPSE